MRSSRLPEFLQRFFTERLYAQLGASPHTIASCRHSFRLFLVFAAARLGRPPSKLRLEEIDLPLIGAFLDHIERERGCSVRTRNIRLSALRAFFRFLAFSEPACALQCQRVLAIPSKRHDKPLVTFLSDQETEVLLAAPDVTTWVGRRDRTILLVAVHTGLRSSELRALRRCDVELGTGAHVRCTGKGRKMRGTPLRRDVAACVAAWLGERRGDDEDIVFPSSRRGPLSADALERLVARHVATAARTCPSLVGRSVTPHCLRHTKAMAMLREGATDTLIALWLGHESVETTHLYLHADMRLKEQALARATLSEQAPSRFNPDDELLAFLEGL
jgi:site-specific recombinase XerD